MILSATRSCGPRDAWRGFTLRDLQLQPAGKASKHNLRHWNLEPYLVWAGAVATPPTALLREGFEGRGKAAQGRANKVWARGSVSSGVQAQQS
jgi:hypothetical protein